MSDGKEWRWEYDPDAEHVIFGLPQHVVGEVERLADELVALATVGVDVTDVGSGPSHGGPAVCAVSRCSLTGGSTLFPCRG
ncbi:hypothetical protein [Streptomyces sp. NPDC058632]|uniref:hypothetical protein n=1 Tax=unclassified Streptomyces TaxID=2593676 RepID=UPI00366A2911